MLGTLQHEKGRLLYRHGRERGRDPLVSTTRTLRAFWYYMVYLRAFWYYIVYFRAFWYYIVY